MRRLEGDDQDKLYESLNPMTDEMLSDSDEIIDEGKQHTVWKIVKTISLKKYFVKSTL